MLDPLYLLFGVLGLAFGSFGNVLVLRFAAEKSIRGRSACPHCHHTLAWYDLIPVLSYIFLQGRCRYCHRGISPRYIVMELVCMGLFLLAYALSPGQILLAASTCMIFFGLLLAVIFDAEHQQIPDAFTGIIFLGALVQTIVTRDFLSGVEGASICIVWFGGQWLISRGRYVGSGDILLGLSLGLWLGWFLTIVMLCISYIVGMIVALYLIATRRAHLDGKTRLAFGPFLATGAMLAFVSVRDLQLTVLTGFLLALFNVWLATAYNTASKKND